MATHEAPPLPTPRADPRVLSRILGEIEDPEEALTDWIDPLFVEPFVGRNPYGHTPQKRTPLGTIPRGASVNPAEGAREDNASTSRKQKQRERR